MSKDWETYQAGGTVRIRRRPVRYRATARTTEPVVEAEADLSSMKKDELVAEAEKRGVDSSGTKAEIIERLES
jgi:hypothetical protein